MGTRCDEDAPIATSTCRELCSVSTRLWGSRGCSPTGSSSSVQSIRCGSQVRNTRSGRSSSRHAPHGTTRSPATTSYHSATGRCGPKKKLPPYDDPVAGRSAPSATSSGAKP